MARFVCIPFVALAAFASADDGFISFGGSPRLLSAHPQIEMSREDVAIVVKGGKARVRAKFIFKNHGAATKVRMGFPDTDAREENGEPTKMRRRPYLQDFRSWVDSKRVSTEMVRAQGSLGLWHAKTVAFNRNQTRTVIVAYWTELGGRYLGEIGTKAKRAAFSSACSYMMSTGASWRGPIGYARVTVTISEAAIRPPFVMLSDEAWLHKAIQLPGRAVHASGFSKPVAKDRQIVFERTHFEPSADSDILVEWFAG